MMSGSSNKDDRTTTLLLWNFGKIFGQPDHRRHATGIVNGAVENSVAMSNNVDFFIRHARQCPPDDRCFQIGYQFHVHSHLHMWWLICRRLADQVSHRESVGKTYRKGRNGGAAGV